MIERERSTKHKNTCGALAKLVIEEELSVGKPRYIRVLLYISLSLI
jgi:hypothetical protein